MAVPGLVLWCDMFHECFQVDPGSWIITLADNQGCTGVLYEKGANPLLDAPFLDPFGDGSGDGNQTFASCRDLNGVFVPVHGIYV